MKHFLFIALACYTINDIKNNVCYQYCRREKGVEYGFYAINKDSCVCGEETSYTDVTRQTFTLAPVHGRVINEKKRVIFFNERDLDE